MLSLILSLTTNIWVLFLTSTVHLQKQKTTLLNKQQRPCAVITKARQLNLPIDLQLHLFDTLVLPIILYGCEVWGYENIRVLDKIHLKFSKILLGVNKSTSTNIVLGELGRFPIEIYIKSRMIRFLSRLVCDNFT